MSDLRVLHTCQGNGCELLPYCYHARHVENGPGMIIKRHLPTFTGNQCHHFAQKRKKQWGLEEGADYGQQVTA